MKRGSVVTVALQGDNGKPRPALVIQSDRFEDISSRVVLLPMTSDLLGVSRIRYTVEPRSSNGLRTRSQVMIDRVSTAKREKIGRVIGSLRPSEMREIGQSLAFVLGLADKSDPE